MYVKTDRILFFEYGLFFIYFSRQCAQSPPQCPQAVFFEAFWQPEHPQHPPRLTCRTMRRTAQISQIPTSASSA